MWERHPRGYHWDEANYINQAFRDTGFFEDGIVRLAKALLFEDRQRPPAYRIFALLTSITVGPSIFVFRLSSWILFLTSVLIIVRAAKDAGADSFAMAAAAAICLVPATASSAPWFGTEGPLYSSVALMIIATVRILRGLSHGVTLLFWSVVIGTFSKATFFVLAIPTLALLLASSMRSRHYRIASRLLVVLGAALAPASIWWSWNAPVALDYLWQGRTFERASLGSALSPEVLLLKLRILLHVSVGIPVTIAAIMGLALIRRRVQGERDLILVLSSGAFALLLSAAMSPVFVPRHFSPAFLPLALVVALTFRSRTVSGLVVVAALLQTGFVYASLRQSHPALHDPDPVSLLSSYRIRNQLDFDSLKNEIEAGRTEVSGLGLVGLASGAAPPQVAFSWVKQGKKIRVAWLWRFEHGPPSLDSISKRADRMEVILIFHGTAEDERDLPYEIDAGVLDNAYNQRIAELFERRYEKPRLLVIPGTESDALVEIYRTNVPRGKTDGK